MTSLSSLVRWIAIALVGLAIAAAVAFAASKVVSQRIGLSSEPLNAGKELAPPEAHPRQAEGSPDRTAPTTTTTTTTTTTAPSTTTATIPATPTTTAPAPSTSVPSSDGSTSEGQGPDD